MQAICGHGSRRGEHEHERATCHENRPRVGKMHVGVRWLAHVALLLQLLSLAAPFGRLRGATGGKPFLSDTELSGCIDSRKECKRWARDGECDANPGFMRKECRASCNECQSADCYDQREDCMQGCSTTKYNAVSCKVSQGLVCKQGFYRHESLCWPLECRYRT